MDIEKQIDAARGLLRKKGPEQWEIMAVGSRQLKIAVKGGQVDNFQRSKSLGMAIRLVHKGKQGLSYLMGAGPGETARAVDEAWASALASDMEDPAGFAPAGDLPRVGELYDPALEAEPLEDKRGRALAMAQAAGQADSRVVHVHPAEVSEQASEVRLVNSLGLDLSRRGTSVSAVAVAMASDGKAQETGWDARSRRFLAEVDPVEVGRQAGIRAAAMLGGEPVSDGRYPIILENRVAAEFLEILASSLLGDNVVKGRSLLAGSLGKKALSPSVTIIDDGLMPRALGTAPFDDEGTAHATRTLVDKGVVQGFAFDRLWGARHGGGSTGNAGRGSLKAPVQVAFHNLHIKAGSASYGELVNSMGKGLIINEVMGAHTADPVSGEFSLGASGFLVEGGKPGRPVKSIALAGQVVDLFASVEGVSADLEFFGSTGCPSLLVSGLSVSGP